MSLRLKAFLVLGVVMTALFFIANQALSRLMVSEFVVLERQEMETDVARAAEMMRFRMDDLSVKLTDWAQWDDTYQYVSDQNEEYRGEYVESNLTDETFGTLRVDLIVIGDRSGAPIYARQMINGEEKPFPESFKEHLAEDVPELFDDRRERFEEVISLPEGLLVYAVRPVTSSDGKAETNGFMVFGYFFDQADADVLGSMAHLRVRYAPLSFDQPLPDDFASANEHLSREHPVYVPDPGEADKVSGYMLVEGGHGKPVMLFRVEKTRDIYDKGQESIALFAKFLAASSAVLVLALFFISDWLVLRKIARLAIQVKKVRESGDLEASVRLPGKDEFAKLAQEVDGMLESMRETEARRQQQMDEVEKLNRLMVNRELKMIELKQQIREMNKKKDE